MHLLWIFIINQAKEPRPVDHDTPCPTGLRSVLRGWYRGESRRLPESTTFDSTEHNTWWTQCPLCWVSKEWWAFRGSGRLSDEMALSWNAILRDFLSKYLWNLTLMHPFHWKVTFTVKYDYSPLLCPPLQFCVEVWSLPSSPRAPTQLGLMFWHDSGNENDLWCLLEACTWDLQAGKHTAFSFWCCPLMKYMHSWHFKAWWIHSQIQWVLDKGERCNDQIESIIICIVLFGREWMEYLNGFHEPFI